MDEFNLMNHAKTGFPDPIKKGDLIMTCYFWLEDGCSFEDGEWPQMIERFDLIKVSIEVVEGDG